MSIPDLLLPNSWFPHEMQAEMLAANIKTPVYTAGLADKLGYQIPSYPIVCVPSFGGTTLRNVYTATGGNPLANYNNKNLCVVMTPTINKFSYSKTVHGVPMKVKDMIDEGDAEALGDDILEELVAAEQGHLPPGFREDCIDIQQIAMDTIMAFTDQRFEVVATKLSPLSSGKGNIAIFLNFPSGCPFDQQQFLDSGVTDRESNLKTIQIRVIPSPIVSRFDEPQNGIKFAINFLDVDNHLFNKAFPLIQHVIMVALPGANLRYAKPDSRNRQLVGLVQMPYEAQKEDLTRLSHGLSKINYNPYIFKTVSSTNTIIE